MKVSSPVPYIKVSLVILLLLSPFIAAMAANQFVVLELQQKIDSVEASLESYEYEVGWRVVFQPAEESKECRIAVYRQYRVVRPPWSEALLHEDLQRLGFVMLPEDGVTGDSDASFVRKWWLLALNLRSSAVAPLLDFRCW